MDRASGILLPISALPSPYGSAPWARRPTPSRTFSTPRAEVLAAAALGPTSYATAPTRASPPSPAIPTSSTWTCWRRRASGQGGPGRRRLGERPPVCGLRQDLRGSLRRAPAGLPPGPGAGPGAVERFQAENPWLKNYALYMAVKAHFGMKSWLEWPDEAIRVRAPEAVARYEKELAEDVAFYNLSPVPLLQQWGELREYIHSLGIRIIGDLPSTWPWTRRRVAEPEFSSWGGQHPHGGLRRAPGLLQRRRPAVGQPLYDYDRMRQDGFGWWIRRVEGASRLFDVIRIDHFRGLESYWAVPYGAETAREGRWRKGPGMDLVGVLTQWFHGLDIIAEDLGFLTPEVHQLLRDSGLPGMKVLEFAFDAREPSNYLPPHLRAQLRVLRGHPRQRDRDAVAGAGGPGRRDLRPEVSGPERGRGLPLGDDPGRHVQRGGHLRGPDAGLPGPGGRGPDEHPGHPGEQLALAPPPRGGQPRPWARKIRRYAHMYGRL